MRDCGCARHSGSSPALTVRPVSLSSAGGRLTPPRIGTSMNALRGPVRDRATITRTRLGIHPHFGGFTWEWSVDYQGGGSQTIGCWALDDKPAPGTHERTPTAYGMAFILALLAAAGVDHWQDLVGREVIVVRDGPRGTATGVGPVDGQPGTPFQFADVSKARA